ncbi:AAA family ATPase [Endozoicomonas sp. SESOKO2]|uniref:AAA family ATPase n=1 Tax=Endozoicomonas sp. SESOKO2 TaxID=2828743 RepID=UPI0021475FF4|nr:AAA family ATPase [Endozoicomonas sp. SESOKO2]
MSYIPRVIEPYLQACLADTPVVVITGPRQSGKTTLARHFLNRPEYEETSSYLTLDDENILAIARNDPIGLLRSQSRPVVIDEVQRAPELIRNLERGSLSCGLRQPKRIKAAASSSDSSISLPANRL